MSVVRSNMYFYIEPNAKKRIDILLSQKFYELALTDIEKHLGSRTKDYILTDVDLPEEFKDWYKISLKKG